jgi:outer membrane protein
MIRFVFLGVFLVWFSSSPIAAQRQWDLRSCIEYAVENSLSIKQSQIGLRNAQVSKQLAVESRFPSLNLNTSLGSNFGRTIDPTTNSFVVSSLYTNGFALNTGFVLYDGSRINNTVARASMDILAANKDLDVAVNDLSLSVAQAFLNVLLAYDNLEAARANLQLTQEQLDQISNLVKAGSLAEADQYEVESQLARNEQDVINAENNVTLGLLQLKQLMFLDPQIDLIIQRPTLNVDEFPPIATSSEVLAAAMTTQPQIAAGEYRLQSALKEEKIAKSGYYPTLSTFAQLNTNYSSLFRAVEGFDVIQTPPTPVFINGEQSTIQFFQEVPRFVDQRYFDQLDRNLGVGVGVQLSIPIYSNGRTRLGVEQAKLNKYSVEIRNEQIKQQLQNDVERAIAEVKAGRQNYLAAQKSVKAAERVLQDANNRYNAGTINAFDYTNAKTRYDNAVITELLAKYEYIFRLKVVDFYLGRPLELN